MSFLNQKSRNNEAWSVPELYLSSIIEYTENTKGKKGTLNSYLGKNVC